MRFRHAVWILSTMIGLIALIACGGGSKKATQPPPPTPTPVSAQSILSGAAQRFDQINSLHFDLQVDGNVALDKNGSIKLRGANGDLLRPSSAKAKANVSFMGANLSINMVSIGTEQYITNPISGNWEKAPSDLGYDPAVLFDKNQGISHVLTSVQNPTIAGSESVNGKDAYHITGTVRKQDVAPIAGGALNGDNDPVDLWIDKKTGDVVKLVIHDTAANGGNTGNTWTLLLTQQNEQVTISKPNL